MSLLQNTVVGGEKIYVEENSSSLERLCIIDSHRILQQVSLTATSAIKATTDHVHAIHYHLNE